VGTPDAVSRDPLRVMVVSSHGLTRAGLTQLLRADPQRVRVVGTSPDAVQSHDVTVYDLTDLACYGGDNRVHLTSDSPVVGLAPPDRPDLPQAALAIGVAAIVPMEVSAQDLIEAVESVVSGRCSGPAAHSERRDAIRAAWGLSRRELEILELIVAGLSNNEIAATLWLSINSVKTYIRTAYRKIGVRRRPEAVRWGYHHGLAGTVDDG
jgi:NarL family two-component system response regulator LiaR